MSNRRGRVRGIWALAACSIVACVTTAAGLVGPQHSAPDPPATSAEPATDRGDAADSTMPATHRREARQTPQRRRRSRPHRAAVRAPRTYSVLQMNLCLSGYAGCYDSRNPGVVVGEATRAIAGREPDAVTLNEVCRADVRGIADRTGYHLRFAAVRLSGRALHCVDPGGRGLFGNAVLTKAPVAEAVDQAFAAQAGIEERRWMCVRTARRVDVCTAHLSTRAGTAGRAANDAQCAEFAAVLASRQSDGPVVAAGDINRRGACAPADAWARDDAGAAQLPGLQHVYVSPGAWMAPSVDVEPAAHTDHDFLLVEALLDPSR